ncbi:hypothetical protein Tco_0099888 [Tanacetum coccineum]
MHVMMEMVTGIQGDKIEIEHLMQGMEMMTAIRLFSVFHELIQLQERQMFSVITVKGHYARNCQKPRVRDAKYFREKLLLAMKYEAGSNLKDEENDFMLDNSYGDETLEELTAAVIMMARIQPADDNADFEPSYNAKVVSEVNASTKVHEQVNYAKRKTIIHTSDDDQIDYNIIFDDPYWKIMVAHLNMIQMLMMNIIIFKCWHIMFNEKMNIKND